MYSVLVFFVLSAPQAPVPPQAPPVVETPREAGPTSPAPAGEGWQWSERNQKWWRWKIVPGVYCGPRCQCGCGDGEPCTCGDAPRSVTPTDPEDGTQFVGCAACSGGGSRQTRHRSVPVATSMGFGTLTTPVTYAAAPVWSPPVASWAPPVYQPAPAITCVTPVQSWPTQGQFPAYSQPAPVMTYSAPASARYFSAPAFTGGACPGGNCPTR